MLLVVENLILSKVILIIVMNSRCFLHVPRHIMESIVRIHLCHTLVKRAWDPMLRYLIYFLPSI